MNIGYKLGYIFDFLVVGFACICFMKGFLKINIKKKNFVFGNFCFIFRLIIGFYIFFISSGCVFLYIFYIKNFSVDC